MLHFSLSANEQIALLVQERDTFQANELRLGERVMELMDEIEKLNEDIAKFKQDKIGNHTTINLHRYPLSPCIWLKFLSS